MLQVCGYHAKRPSKPFQIIVIGEKVKKLLSIFLLLFVGAVIMAIGTAVKREKRKKPRDGFCYGDYET